MTVQTPEQLPDVIGPARSLIVRGQSVEGDLLEALTAATLDLSYETVGELSLTFYDPVWELLESRVFALRSSVDFGTLRMEVAQLETAAAADGRGQLVVKARARVVGALKRRTGKMVLAGVSPSDFVRRECEAVGAKFVIQESAKRKQVARDAGAVAFGDTVQSSWTTFERLARELGFVVFESMGIVYFGKPSWLRERTTALSVVTFDEGRYTDALSVPAFRENEDAPEALSCQVELPPDRVGDFLPGMRSRVIFAPYGDDNYLVTALSYPLLGGGNISVTVGKPRDPVPEGQSKGGGSSSGRTGSKNGGGGSGGGGTVDRTLGTLLYRAGFRGEALRVACGIAIAESGGVANGRAFVRAKVLGDVSLQTSKWGPSVGVFQIRSLRNPGAYSGTDRLRVQSKLDDALYNAQTAFKISNGGRSWGAWSTFSSGAYRAHVGKTGAIVEGWGGIRRGGSKTKKQKDGRANSSPTGRRSANDFVNLALKQVGDRYVYGAEASKSSANPSVFDCSELVEWAAARVGVFIPDGSSNQMAYLRSKRTATSVETAIRTRGALLWKPGHIAISLGNGRTVEALNPSMGVRVMSARERSFSWQGGGRIPGMRY